MTRPTADSEVWALEFVAEYVRKNHFTRYMDREPVTPMTDLATIAAILYAARYQRRVPETDAEKRGTIAASVADARLILAAVNETVTTPEQPPPSPGNNTGVFAEAKATRRRG